MTPDTTVLDVILEPYELRRAADVGLERGLTYQHGWNHAQTYLRDWHDRLEDEIIKGAWCECAFAKAMNLYWHMGVDTVHNVADVGENWEIRGITNQHHCLIVRDHEPRADRNYALVIAKPPHFRVAGWLPGADVVNDEWRRDPNGHGRPAWFVPQAYLKPMTDALRISGLTRTNS